MGKSKEHLLKDLVEEVRSRHLQPEDFYEIAALLESMGWNDERVRNTFGVEHVFELASMIWDMIQQGISFAPFVPDERQKLIRLLQEIVRQFFRGMIFSLPMVISVLSMLSLKFSLWSYENLTVDIATAIGIGTIASFVVVGGFTQAIARRGFFYIMLGYYNMARRMTFYFIRLGFKVCLVVCLLIYAVNFIFNLFPLYMVFYSLLYFFFLNSIWLCVTVYYILRKEIVFTGLIVFGIFLVWVLFDFLKITNIIVSQLISLFVVSMVSVLLVFRYFNEAERKMEKGIAPQMPRMSITLYSTMPYFIYGFIYFAFLFVDRVFAWSTPDAYIPYVVWFRGQYEIGMDIALLVLVVPMGISEVVVSKMMNDIQASQKGYLGSEIKQMNTLFVRIYVKHYIVMWVVSIVSALALYFTTEWFFKTHPNTIGISLIQDGTTHFVYVWALIGYVLVATALLNAVIMFSLSQPKKVLQSIVPAFALDMAVGFVASRWAHFLIGHNNSSNMGYAYSVFGLVSGAALFSILSTRNVLMMIRKLDYYMYAAS